MIIETPILAYYKKSFETIIETNFSDHVNSRVFFQFGKDRLLYLIFFFFKNLNPANYNYKIYDKDLLGIFFYFEQEKPKLKGTSI